MENISTDLKQYIADLKASQKPLRAYMDRARGLAMTKGLNITEFWEMFDTPMERPPCTFSEYLDLCDRLEQKTVLYVNADGTLTIPAELVERLGKHPWQTVRASIVEGESWYEDGEEYYRGEYIQIE